MHGIFTRVFLSFWAAILLIAAAAVAVTAINFRAKDTDPVTITRRAAAVLEHSGLPGLRVWLAERNKSLVGQRILIIDRNGRDINGQPLPQHGPWFPRWRDHPPPQDRPDNGENDPVQDAYPPPPPHDAAGPAARTQDGGEPPPGPPNFGGDDGPRFAGPSLAGDFPAPPGGLFLKKDGETYRVLFDPPPRRGPFSPPFTWLARGVLLGLAIIISGLISYLLARSIAAPLRDLKSATRELSTGNLNARADERVALRRDELGTLAREFDSMAERLSALIMARQQLLRDISHELRSPLARLQMALQLLRQDASSADSQLDRIERESQRLEMLIDQVLEYARLERDPATLRFEAVDLVELVGQIVHDATFESQSAPDRLQYTHPESLLLRADPNLLHAVIDNVVRNALIHAGESSRIEISLRATPEAVTIAVRDHGPGVPEAELQKIFEPFYRVIDSVSHKARFEGSGIGLAIAARAVALHGGRISAQNAPDGGLLVTMILPRAAAA